MSFFEKTQEFSDKKTIQNVRTNTNISISNEAISLKSNVVDFGLKALEASLIPWPLKGKSESVIRKAGEREKYYGEIKWTPESFRQMMVNAKAEFISLLLGPIFRPEKLPDRLLQLGCYSLASNLICLDFDRQGTREEFFKRLDQLIEESCKACVENPDGKEIAYRKVVAEDTKKRLENTYSETTRKGAHFLLWVTSQAMEKKETYGEYEKQKFALEILAGKNAYVVVAPSPGYNAEKEFFDHLGNARIASIYPEHLEIIREIAKSLPSITTASKKKISPPHVTDNQNYGSESKADRANRYLLSLGWRYALEKFGYQITSVQGDKIYACHPNSTDLKNHNCVAGPRGNNEGNTFHAFSPHGNIEGGKNYTAFNFWKAHGVSPAEIFQMVDDDSGSFGDENTNTGSKFDDWPGSSHRYPTKNDAVAPSIDKTDETEDEENSWLELERKQAREIRDVLRSPVEGSLINICTDTLRESCSSKHTSTVIPGAFAITLLGDIAARYMKYENSYPVLHTIIIARTGHGKDHPKVAIESVFEHLNKLQNNHEQTFGPNGTEEKHPDCQMYYDIKLELELNEYLKAKLERKPKTEQVAIPSDNQETEAKESGVEVQESETEVQESDNAALGKEPANTGNEIFIIYSKEDYFESLSPEEKNSIAYRANLTKWKPWKDGRIINPTGSKEGIDDTIRYHPHCILAINEFGDFCQVAENTRDSMGLRNKAILNHLKILFDCPKKYFHRALALSKNPKHRELAPPGVTKNVRASLIAFTTPGNFEKYFDLDSIDSGSLNRLLFFTEGPKWMSDDLANAPKNRFKQDEAVKQIGDAIFEHIKFYHREILVDGKKIAASKAFQEYYKRYVKEKSLAELKSEKEGTADKEEGIAGREEQIVKRLILVHLFSRKSLMLELVDLEWAIGVARASQRCVWKVVDKARRHKNSRDNSEAELEKVANYMIKLHEQNEVITPARIGNKAFGRKRMIAEEFKAVYEPILIQRGWIRVEGSNYEVTKKLLRKKSNHP